MVENNFGFNKNEVIHCPTEELAVKVLQIAHERGYKWSDKVSYLDNSEWECYKENTCYYLCDGDYSCILYAVNKGYKVIKAEDFLKQHNKNINNHKPYLVWN